MAIALKEGDEPILFPKLEYLTNDSWSTIEILDGDQVWSVFHFAPYANSRLWIWMIPDQFADLYKLPEQVLNSIREEVGKSLGFWLQGPPKVSLFLYDNQTLVLHNFSDEAITVSLLTEDSDNPMIYTSSGEAVDFVRIPEKPLRGNRVIAERLAFKIDLLPHGFERLEW